MRETGNRGIETRARIIEAAGRLFRERGIDAVGVDAVMRAAGLTHGGFYTHFASKEALVAEVAAQTLARSAAKWEEIASPAEDETARRAALARIVESYLHPSHVAGAARGCLLPALGADVARRPAARAGITHAMRSMIAALARCLPQPERERAAATLCTLVGAVVLARAANDRDLADMILTAARNAALSNTG